MALQEGLMQEYSLVVTSILDFAARWHGEQQVISLEVDGQTTRSNYAQVDRSARLTTLALRALGVRPGDCVATLAFNTLRHLCCWFGIAGLGAVCHTLNPRLFIKDLEYIINHAEDTVILLDAPLAELVAQLKPNISTVKAFIVLTDRAHMPDDTTHNAGSTQPEWLCFDELLQAQVANLPGFKWTPVPENSACGLCFTSGTTGRPKGVLYSHRSNFLHALQLGFANAVGLGMTSTVLMIVPMFHANSWGYAYAAPMFGARLVLPGPNLQGDVLCRVIGQHGVSIAAGVPTVFADMLLHLERTGSQPAKSLTHVNIGGAAMPQSMQLAFERYGVRAVHAWGMTELSPIGTFSNLKTELLAAMLMQSHMSGWSTRRLQAAAAKQGLPLIFTDLRIVDQGGRELPRDGRHMGELQARGAHTTRAYLKSDKPAVDGEGWFSTGDVASIDEHGYMQISDRSKDVIKSGGEWISSIDIENLACAHPQVAEAAVIAIPHTKWGERPLLLVVPKRKGAVTAEGLLEHLKDKLAKWWLPDDIIFVDELPHTATGKLSKLQLRQRYKDHKPAQARL